MPLSKGDRLGPYQILALVGKGGMGEVYRARDDRLRRDVAVKVSNAQFTERFTREARVIASLNHTNIAHLYDVGANYLVMEFVEGQDLKGPLAFNDALPIINQLIDGIEAAHEKGIVHRDLKPANIKITPEGVVKILDFGLAKATDPTPSTGGDPENSPTLTMSATVAGTILGTAAYMSPEQAKGKVADKRADIWSFGVVLYEMLTGKRLFQGESTVEVLAGVLNKEADLSTAPARAHKLLRWCLEKDRKQRLASISDARRMLAEDVPAFDTDRGQYRLSHSNSWVSWGVAAMATLALAAGSFIHFRQTVPERPLVRLDVDLGADVSLPPVASTASVPGSSVAISPDGMRLAYVSGPLQKLFTRRLDQSKATELPGTEGASAPFFAPDSQWIGFQGSGNKLNKISVDGSAVVPLADLGRNIPGNWGEDGNIYVGGAGGLLRIRDGGGVPETLAPEANGEVTLAFPQLLPGGKAVLFSAYTALTSDASSIEVMTLTDHHRKTISRGTSPRYVASANGTGYLVYLNKATLFAIPFDLDKLQTYGNAVPLLDDVASNGRLGIAHLSISRAGTLVYRKSGGEDGLLTVEWLDNAGKMQPLLSKPGAYIHPSISPLDERLVLEVGGGSGTDIWVYDWKRDTMTRLTFDGRSRYPIWSPDGRYIVLQTVGEGMSVTRSDGAGKPQPLTSSKNLQYPWSFTADGKRMTFMERDPKTADDLWTVPIESDGTGLRAGKPEVFLQTAATETNPAFSPDGRWLAYVSSESGTEQIYVRAFPDKGGKWQISIAGGRYPMWSRTGYELFFETLDNRIMAAAYTVKGDSLASAKPRLWSDTQIGGDQKNFDLAPDGKRIAAMMPAMASKGSQESQNHVVFLENFLDELQRKVGAKGVR